MGEVYRARDTRLDRDVAVKVLPARLAEDPEALARFEREAKAVAALSHPGILAIHDFGREGGTAYAAMELLDGETLRQRLSGGPLPVRKAVDLAQQITQALAAAHEKGIVHRDLKPENVFVTRDGRAKLLDFGLARREGGGAPGDDTHSPTLAHATEPGTVLGTVGYMSPEQVRGQPADARSDIFSFGSVLYEMLTGRRAFGRETGAETMTAILREEPPELSSVQGGLPPALGRIVQHCLEKQPEERFQSARDLAFDLSSLADSQVRHERVGEAGPARSPGRHAGAVLLIMAGALAGLVLGRVLWRGRAQGPRPLAGAHFVQLTDQSGIEKDPSLSPDGKSVVYAADPNGNLDLFLLRVGGRNPVNLTPDSPGDDQQPAFSPDGEQIAFRSERDGGGIFVMGSTGESVKRLTDFGFHPSWSPDGREIVVAAGSFTYPTDVGAGVNDLWAVSVATGEKRRVTRGTRAALQPKWSPHGKRIAYWGLRQNSGQRDLWTVAADGSEPEGGVAVTDDAPLDWSPTWSPDGTYLYFSSSRGGTMNLWRVPIDEASGRTRGEPEPLTTPSLWSGEPSLSKDGQQLAFATLDWRSTLLRVGFDPVREEIVGAPAAVLRSTKPIRDHDLSPDGQWVAFNQAGVREDLVVVRLDGSQYRRLTDDEFRDRGPKWTPDGQRIGFYSDRGGAYEIWTIRPDGSGLAPLTRASKSSMNFPVWSPDGRQFATSAIPGDWLLFDLDPATDSVKEVPVPRMEHEKLWPQSWSPDGKRLAGPLVGEDGAVGGIGLFSFVTKSYQVKRLGSNVQWVTPVWLRDSRRLLVRDQKGISVVEPGSWRWKRLLDVGGYMIGESVSISRDDRLITYTETANEGDIWLVSLR
jgi:Tol biopolymer transport system component